MEGSTVAYAAMPINVHETHHELQILYRKGQWRAHTLLSISSISNTNCFCNKGSFRHRRTLSIWVSTPF